MYSCGAPAGAPLGICSFRFLSQDYSQLSYTFLYVLLLGMISLIKQLLLQSKKDWDRPLQPNYRYMLSQAITKYLEGRKLRRKMAKNDA